MAEIQLPGSQTGALPADLPTDWGWEQIVPPNGADIGMPERYGYNYLMQQVNKVQQVANAAGVSLEDVYASLANKVDVGTPRVYDITFETGIAKHRSAFFLRDSSGIVLLHLGAVKKDGTDFPYNHGTPIATLPVGCRPPFQIETTAIFSKNNISAFGSVIVHSNGEITTHTLATTNLVICACRFPTVL